MSDSENITMEIGAVDTAQSTLEDFGHALAASRMKVEHTADNQTATKWSDSHEVSRSMKDTSDFVENMRSRLHWLNDVTDEFVQLVEQTKRDFQAADERGQAAMLAQIQALAADDLARFEGKPHHTDDTSTPFPTCSA